MRPLWLNNFSNFSGVSFEMKTSKKFKIYDFLQPIGETFILQNQVNQKRKKRELERKMKLKMIYFETNERVVMEIFVCF